MEPGWRFRLSVEISPDHGCRVRILSDPSVTTPCRIALTCIQGQILDIGADWALVDPKTNIAASDTRYNLRTHDGADIYVQTSGPQSPSGQLHLRLVFETGSTEYYWLNNIVGKYNIEIGSSFR